MESPHASSRVILKANINQFCIVDCPRAVCNTCGVFPRMDVPRRISAQTSDDNCEEADSVSLSFIILGAHMPCNDPSWAGMVLVRVCLSKLTLEENLFSLLVLEIHQEIVHSFQSCRYDLSGWLDDYRESGEPAGLLAVARVNWHWIIHIVQPRLILPIEFIIPTEPPMIIFQKQAEVILSHANWSVSVAMVC